VPNTAELNKARELAPEVITTPVVHQLPPPPAPPQELERPPVIGIVASHLAHGPAKPQLAHQLQPVPRMELPKLIAMLSAVVMEELHSFATTNSHSLLTVPLPTVSLLLLLLDKVNLPPVVPVTN